MAKQNLGMVTAYAYAVVGGYEGTEAEFEALLGNIATDLEEIENLTVIANTLPAGSAATASYDHGVLTLGIPKGDKGDTGAGATVAAGTTTTGAPGTNASVVNAGTAKDAVFNFTIPRGDTGNGIESIYLTGTSGAVKTYTILFTDGNTTTFNVTDGEVTNDALTAILADYAKTDGAYESMTVGNAEQLISSVYVTDEEPYQFRTSGGSADIGDREFDTLVGGSVAWNQLVNIANGSRTDRGVTASLNTSTGVITLSGTTSTTYSACLDPLPAIANHKYIRYMRVLTNPNNVSFDIRPFNIGWSQGIDVCNSNDTVNSSLGIINVPANTSMEGITLYVGIIDLTQLFGSTIADYIYTLEQGQAGAGVAWFKKLFPKPYYEYNAGELISVSGLESHDTVGFNQWDEEWESGAISASTGNPSTNADYSRSKNFCKCLPNTNYYRGSGTVTNLAIFFYDANQNYIGVNYFATPQVFTTPSNAYYFKVHWNATTYNHDICINLSWDGERNGEYEPYVEHSYPLDSSLTLRGIPKIANGKLYYDGDTYESDGTVTRKYGIVDLGTLDWYAISNNNYANFYTTVVSDIMYNASAVNIICSAYKAGANNTVLASDDKYVWINTEKRIRIKDTSKASMTASEFKSAMSGVYLVYELATPTTETADTFVNPQIVDDFGTEEYVTTSIVPVGHETKYTNNLKAKLEMSPDSPSSDGDYIVRQTSGTNEYVPLGSTTTISNIITRLEALENA